MEILIDRVEEESDTFNGLYKYVNSLNKFFKIYCKDNLIWFDTVHKGNLKIFNYDLLTKKVNELTMDVFGDNFSLLDV